jgi:hypothetical protein
MCAIQFRLVVQSTILLLYGLRVLAQDLLRTTRPLLLHLLVTVPQSSAICTTVRTH